MVYVLRFQSPLGNPHNRRGQARYYVGWCKDGTLHRRLAQHRAGTGAAITRAAIAQGIDFDVVLTIPNASRDDERRIKRQKNTPRFVQRYTRQQQLQQISV